MATRKAPDTAALIRAANKTLGAFVAKGDAKSIGNLYTRTARLMPPGMDVCKGRHIAAFWQGAIDSGVRGAALKTAEVEQHGTTAIEWGTYKLLGEARSELDRGKYVVIWKREAGQWKLHRDIFNSSKAG